MHQAIHNTITIASTKGTDKSFLRDRVDPQELFNTYAGTGIMELDK